MQTIPSTCTIKQYYLHCKEKMPKIWSKDSQKRNIGASIPISTFMCLWAKYIFPWWVCLFCWRKYVDWSWEYINRSKTHECGNWGEAALFPEKEYINGIAVAVHPLFLYIQSFYSSLTSSPPAKSSIKSYKLWSLLTAVPQPLTLPKNWT